MSALPPVLLLHGFGGSAARTWRDNGWIDLLGDTGRPVIAPDLPGHGPGAHSHDPADYVDVEGRVSAALPDGPVDAIGFSMGARVLLALAQAHPDRFRRIVVAGVGENLFRPSESQFLVAALRDPAPHANPVARYFQQLVTTTDADALALAAFLERPDSPAVTVETLSRITVPVLVVIGDEDFAGPADPLVAALPQATLQVLRRTDHFSTPKSFGFIDAALDFLSAP